MDYPSSDLLNILCDKNNNISSYQCKYCNKEFSESYTLRNHLLSINDCKIKYIIENERNKEHINIKYYREEIKETLFDLENKIQEFDEKKTIFLLNLDKILNHLENTKEILLKNINELENKKNELLNNIEELDKIKKEKEKEIKLLDDFIVV